MLFVSFISKHILLNSKKIFLKTLIVSLFSLSGFLSFSQNDIVKWRYYLTKKSDIVYEIHLKATISNGWHIYSQFTPAGGPNPTVIKFNRNPLIKIVGKPNEIGRVNQRFEKVFGVNVRFYNTEIDFVQLIQLQSKIKTNVAGTIYFMTCNDETCLPPLTNEFNIKLE